MKRIVAIMGTMGFAAVVLGAGSRAAQDLPAAFPSGGLSLAPDRRQRAVASGGLLHSRHLTLAAGGRHRAVASGGQLHGLHRALASDGPLIWGPDRPRFMASRFVSDAGQERALAIVDRPRSMASGGVWDAGQERALAIVDQPRSMASGGVSDARQERALAIVGGTLVDGMGGPPLADAVVVVRGDTVVAAGARAEVEVPAGAEVVDATGMTVLPGLIDGHVHLGVGAFVGDPTPVPQLLRAALARGVTTLVDLGDAHPWILGLRDSVAHGLVEGPRILAAGAVITAPGGHPAGTWLRGSAEAAAVGTRQVGAPEEARSAVRRLVEDGVDVVKVVYDGGSERSPFGLLPRLDSATLAAALAAARTAGRPALVHWQQAADLGAVLAARPDVLVHLSVGRLPQPAIDAIVASHAIVQPTAGAFARVFPDELFRRLYLVNVAALVRAGARLSVGTDAPIGGPFGDSVLRELELLVEAGLSPAQALAAATSNAADAVGREDLGRIRAGARADLLVVAGDPLESIAALRDMRLVVAAGQIVVR